MGKIKSVAYLEGEQARLDGLDIEDNPYIMRAYMNFITDLTNKRAKLDWDNGWTGKKTRHPIIKRTNR